MAEQLTLLGTWEPIAPAGPAAERGAAPPDTTDLPDLREPDDPRQAWLFDGPHSIRQAAERACEQLDAAALRLSWHQAVQRYPTWPGARPWPLWSLGIEHLLGEGAPGVAPIPASEQARRALTFALAGAEAGRRFPEMSAPRVHRVRAAALCRAATRLLEEDGAAARLPDGRPAGYLHLLAGVPDEAVASLQRQAQACDGATRAGVLGYLGEAQWRCGRPREALAAYRDAYLLDPAAVDEKEMTCRPVMDLLDSCADLEPPDDPRGWLPVMADLLSKVPLPADAASVPDGAGAARRAAALLLVYRQRQIEADEAERLQRKRELLRCAPILKEHVRRL